MSEIKVRDEREYFKRFYVELLTSNADNLQEIEHFSATENGKNLELYLKNKAWDADSEGETKVYLVKDEEDSIALFFSVKCGLLYKKYQYDELDEDKQMFVDMLLDAMRQKDNDTLANYYESGMYTYSEMDNLFNIAHRRMELKLEEGQLQDGGYTLKVEECYPAIEIQHFCRNSGYSDNEYMDVPLGFGIFWEKIVPLICEIAGRIGCKYLYLFAADRTSDKEIRKLVQYYKNELKFSNVEDMMIIKPYYDNNCLGLVQKISELKSNREAIWEEFSDVYR